MPTSAQGFSVYNRSMEQTQKYIVTAYNNEGSAYRYMAATEEDAQNQTAIFTNMGFDRVSSRSILWDANTNSECK